jgi:ABC-type transport system involved in multi-copper enzyme maturation permease subunit
MIGNPVLRKELMRGRIRQPKATLVGLGLAVLVILGGAYYQVIVSLLSDPTPSAGRDAWRTVVWIQFVLIGLLAPVATANAIAQEKEQQTWEMLLFTRLMPGEIILGKLLARMAFLTLVVLLGLPISLFAAFQANRGGVLGSEAVSVGQFVGVYFTMLMCALFFATFGLFMSWLLNRTLYAILSSYTFVVGGLVIGTTMVAGLLSMLTNDGNFFQRCPLMWFNPINMFYNAVTPQQHLDTVFLVYGLIGYGLFTALMIWRMIAGFRRFAYEA